MSATFSSDNPADAADEAEKKGRQSGKYKKVCVTDPDATMATNARNRRLEPAYKQHTAVDDKLGVILDVVVTTGQTNEGDIIEPQVDEVRRPRACAQRRLPPTPATPMPRSMQRSSGAASMRSFRPKPSRSGRAFRCAGSATTPSTTF